jgi:ABC-type polysaccharide/polyol phosphate transport system ATPase subunit
MASISTFEQRPFAVSTVAAPTVASLESVTKNYEQIRALRGVDFDVRSGEVVALLGPNCGQTSARPDPAQLRQGASLRRRPH